MLIYQGGVLSNMSNMSDVLTETATIMRFICQIDSKYVKCHLRSICLCSLCINRVDFVNKISVQKFQGSVQLEVL